MKQAVILNALILSFTFSFAQFYVTKDLTAEHLFTNGIEGPAVDEDGNLYAVNFKKEGSIGWVHADGTVEFFTTLAPGSTGNAILFNSHGDMLVTDYTGHNILKINKRNKVISILAHNAQFNQPNDFCINKKNQLFVSDPNWKTNTGKLWRIEPNGNVVLLTHQMGTANGIELSPDEKILYVNESMQRNIWIFDVDAGGNISKTKRLFYKFDDFGLDGMKCDANGNLYVTRHGKGVVAIISPDGKLIREVQLKGKNVSNITFGGADGRTCYVTVQDRGCIETFRSEIPGRNYAK